MSSAAVVIGALRVNRLSKLVRSRLANPSITYIKENNSNKCLSRTLRFCMNSKHKSRCSEVSLARLLSALVWGYYLCKQPFNHITTVSGCSRSRGGGGGGVLYTYFESAA